MNFILPAYCDVSWKFFCFWKTRWFICKQFFAYRRYIAIFLLDGSLLAFYRNKHARQYRNYCGIPLLQGKLTNITCLKPVYCSDWKRSNLTSYFRWFVPILSNRFEANSAHDGWRLLQQGNCAYGVLPRRNIIVLHLCVFCTIGNASFSERHSLSAEIVLSLEWGNSELQKN